MERCPVLGDVAISNGAGFDVASCDIVLSDVSVSIEPVGTLNFAGGPSSSTTTVFARGQRMGPLFSRDRM